MYDGQENWFSVLLFSQVILCVLLNIWFDPMLIVIGLLKVYIFLEITVIIFFVITIIGTLIYLLSIWLLDKYFEYGISKMIQEQIRLLIK